MTNDKTSDTKPFPGSPTGNQSGVPDNATPAADKKPTETYPGSPTGNASGAGDTQAHPQRGRDKS